MSLFNWPSKYPFGLDISDFSLKLIQLQKKRRKIMLQTAAKIDVPAGVIEGGVIKKSDEFIVLLKKLMAETKLGKVTAAEVIACLPETKTFAKLITLPQDSGNLAELVAAEIEKNIPYPLSEVNHDWQLISQADDGQKILIGAVPKKIAEAVVALLEEAGLVPVALEIEPLAICRSLLPLYQNNEETLLLIDIGAARSGLIAFAGNSILFTASLPISGQKYTKTIAEQLNLPLAKAEIAKAACGFDPEQAQGVVAQVLTGMTEELVAKIKTAQQYLANYFPQYSPVRRLCLSGGGAHLKNLDKVLSDKLQLPVEIGNVFTNITVSRGQQAKYFSQDALAFATAMGLALRGIYPEHL